jgi:hypothetical protein
MYKLLGELIDHRGGGVDFKGTVNAAASKTFSGLVLIS